MAEQTQEHDLRDFPFGVLHVQRSPVLQIGNRIGRHYHILGLLRRQTWSGEAPESSVVRLMGFLFVMHHFEIDDADFDSAREIPHLIRFNPT